MGKTICVVAGFVSRDLYDILGRKNIGGGGTLALFEVTNRGRGVDQFDKWEDRFVLPPAL